MPKTSTKTPQQLAKDAADRYIEALASELPCDTAPGGVDLINAVNHIQDAIEDQEGYQIKVGWEQQSALEAGYLLGFEMGRRLGGVR